MRRAVYRTTLPLRKDHEHEETPASSRIAAILAAVILLVTLAPAPARADGSDLSAVSVAKFAAGIASSMLLHEGALAVVAAATNTHMSWKAGNYNQPIAFTEDVDSDAEGVALYSAGLLTQLGASEVILQVDKINKNDAFVRGMMAWNVLNPILYSLDYWVFRIANKNGGPSYQGDLQGIEHFSREATARASPSASRPSPPSRGTASSRPRTGRRSG